MANLQPHQVKEVNEIIEKIEKAIKPKHEIGSQNKAILANILSANKIQKTPVFFKVRREYTEAIISYFVNEKNLKQNKFHSNGQEFIFLL
jgi:hypothetical protein